MIATTIPAVPTPSAEDLLRDELAVGDAQIGTYAPILRHLLASNEHAVFSDEIIARVRGMMADLARQVMDERATVANAADPVRDHDPTALAELEARLVEHEPLLIHCHALALEWHLTELLQARLALDPVLSPLLQALIASNDTGTATQAMALLAAQARFAQAQRRMQLPVGELPAELLFDVLVTSRTDGASEADLHAENAIRSRFDEGRSRFGLMSRLLVAMGGGLTAALSLGHAGAALFLSALAMASGQDRALITLATTEGQYARLSLALRAAGLKPQSVEEQFLVLFPDVTLPENFDQLGADRAAALLAGARSNHGY